MSEIPLYDESEDIPIPRPRDEVRFESAHIRPYADGRRIKLHFSLTPFLDRPSVELTVTNAAGQEVSSLSLIEAMDTAFDFTVHLRGPQPRGEHTLHMLLYYTESDEPEAARIQVDEHSLTFDPTAAG